MFTGESYVFAVEENGTYFIFGHIVKMPNHDELGCKKGMRFFWKMDATENTFKKFNITSDTVVTEIVALDVQLKKNSEVHFQSNCGKIDQEKTFFRVFRVETVNV